MGGLLPLTRRPEREPRPGVRREREGHARLCFARTARNRRPLDAEIDGESLARAADLETVYQAMRWVDDMPPPPKQKTGKRGRKPDPRSRAQFAKWGRKTYQG